MQNKKPSLQHGLMWGQFIWVQKSGSYLQSEWCQQQHSSRAQAVGWQQLRCAPSPVSAAFQPPLLNIGMGVVSIFWEFLKPTWDKTLAKMREAKCFSINLEEKTVCFHGVGKSTFTVTGFFPASSRNWRCKAGCLSTALLLRLQWGQLLCQRFIPTQLQA